MADALQRLTELLPGQVSYLGLSRSPKGWTATARDSEGDRLARAAYWPTPDRALSELIIKIEDGRA